MGVKMYKSESNMCDSDLDIDQPTTEDVVTGGEAGDMGDDAMESNQLTIAEPPKSASFIDQQNNGGAIGGDFGPGELNALDQTMDQVQELSQQDIENILKDL